MAEAKRKAISKKLRFEVFKRDSFKCQYCGRSAPDVVLHVDHINPVARGGKNDLINLISACVECNSGKGAVQLDDNSVAAKQMRQLAELNERREQIKLIAKWRDGMVSIVEEELRAIDERIKARCGHVLSDSGRNDFRKSLKKYGLEEVLSALETSADQYLQDPKDQEQLVKFINYTHRICFWNKERKARPEVNEFSHICGIANRKWWKCNKSTLWRVVKDAHYNHGVSTADMMDLAKNSTGIMQFEKGLNELTEGALYG